MNNVAPLSDICPDINANVSIDAKTVYKIVENSKNDVELFPIAKPRPTRVWEVKEMINKLSLYQKSATGQLVICYEKALDALCQIDKLELEKEQREAKNANKWL